LQYLPIVSPVVEQKVTELEAELGAVHEQVDALQGQVGTFQGQVGTFQGELGILQVQATTAMAATNGRLDAMGGMFVALVLVNWYSKTWQAPSTWYCGLYVVTRGLGRV